MRTVKQHILSHIEALLHSYRHVVAIHEATPEAGTMYIYDSPVPVAHSLIEYDFDATGYTMRIQWNGMDIPVVMGEDNLDFTQTYIEPTQFFERLRELLEH